MVIKQAERLRGEVVMPSINELRYAGRRLVDAMNLALSDTATVQCADNTAKRRFSAYIGEVEHFCLRAEHDAIDAAILFAHEKIEFMVREFGIELVARFFSDYFAIRKEIIEVDKFMVQSREDREKRDGYYRDLSSIHLPRTVSYYEVMSCSEELLKGYAEDLQKQEQERERLAQEREQERERRDQERERRALRRERVASRWTYTGIVIGLIGLAIGAMGIWLTISGVPGSGGQTPPPSAAAAAPAPQIPAR